MTSGPTAGNPDASSQTVPFVSQGMFGFTNKAEHLEGVRQWRDAAVADGWAIEPTYGDHESVDRAARLSREGFTCQILTRDNSDKGGKWKAEADINVWGPDGLAVKVPAFYSWEALTAALSRCSACKATNVKTTRVGFAGRVCEACLPEQRRRVETPGWNN